MAKGTKINGRYLTDEQATAMSYLQQDQGELIADEKAKQVGRFAADQSAMSREMRANLGVSGLLAGAQIGASLINTAQDSANKKALEKLESRRAAGELGLEADERQLLERMQLDPARAAAAEQQTKLEGLHASMGEATSAADLARIDKETRRGIQETFRKAGLEIAKADLDEKRQELQEIESRIAYKGQRQQQRIDQVVGAIGQAGQLFGKVRAGRAVPRLDIEKMIEAGFDPETVISVINQIEEAPPWQRDQLMAQFGQYAAPPSEPAADLGSSARERSRRRRR